MVPVRYAVVVNCSQSLAGRTHTTSHEVLEASTDPDNGTGYVGLGGSYAAWDTALDGTEVGDMCEHRADAATIPADLSGYTIQRTWSNAAAAALQDPCVPVPPAETGPSFGSVPALPDTIRISGSMAQAVTIPVGQQKTIDVMLYSTGPTSGPWTVSAAEAPDDHTLGFSWDHTMGRNGDVLHLTITANAHDSTGYSTFTIDSTLNGVYSYWVGAVGN